MLNCTQVSLCLLWLASRLLQLSVVYIEKPNLSANTCKLIATKTVKQNKQKPFVFCTQIVTAFTLKAKLLVCVTLFSKHYRSESTWQVSANKWVSSIQTTGYHRKSAAVTTKQSQGDLQRGNALSVTVFSTLLYVKQWNHSLSLVFPSKVWID